MDRVWSAPSGKKYGPEFRCLQLGQNAKEVMQCSKKIGYTALTPEQMLMRLTNARDSEVIDRELQEVLGKFGAKDKHHLLTFFNNKTQDLMAIRLNEETSTVDYIAIDGTQFWGTTEFSEPFFRALMSNYWISELTPIPGSGYTHLGDGWKIIIYTSSLAPTVQIEHISGSDDFTF